MLRGSWEPGRDAGDWAWGPVAAGPRPSWGCGHCLTGDGFLEALEAEGAGPVEDRVGAGPRGGRAGMQRPWGVSWQVAARLGLWGGLGRPSGCRFADGLQWTRSVSNHLPLRAHRQSGQLQDAELV